MGRVVKAPEERRSEIVATSERLFREVGFANCSVDMIIREMGVFGLSIPESYGGLQEDDREDNVGMIVVTEELSRGSLGAAGSLITRPEILARALLKGGTEARRWRTPVRRCSNRAQLRL